MGSACPSALRLDTQPFEYPSGINLSFFCSLFLGHF
jgi:hypothetical protein